MNPARPSISEGSSQTLPTQQDQIRDYRFASRIRHDVQRRLPQSLRGRYKRTLERQLNPEEELRLSRNRQANLVHAETLYEDNWNTSRTRRVYQQYMEERILCIDGSKWNRDYCSLRAH